MQTRIREYLKNVADGIRRLPSITMIGYGTTNRSVLEAVYVSGIFSDITVRQNGKIYDTPPYNVKLMQGVDALVVMAQDPVPLTNVCKKAKAQGKFVAIVSNPLSERVEDVFVNGDNRSFGVEAARALGSELKGQGKIVFLRGMPCPIDNDRAGGFLDTLKAEFPAIVVLESADAYWNTEKGLMAMELLLQKHPQIDGVWAGDDDVLLGAIKAYQKSGRKDVKVFVGGGGAQSVVRMVANGDPVVKATVTYPPEMICTGIEAAFNALKKSGSGTEKEIIIPSKIITMVNAKDFIREGSPY